MRKVETAGEFIVGESYWIFAKNSNLNPSLRKGVLVEVKSGGLTAKGNEWKYIGNKIWCIPGNNQALERFHAYGPYLKPMITDDFKFIDANHDTKSEMHKFVFERFMNGKADITAENTSHRGRYRGVEWTITTFSVRPNDEVHLINLILADVEIETQCTYSLAEAIAEGRKVIDIFYDDLERFEVDYGITGEVLVVPDARNLPLVEEIDEEDEIPF